MENQQNVLHAIDTLSMCLNNLVRAAEEDAAKTVVEKILELVKKIN